MNNAQITVVDYGIGNTGSILNMIRYSGGEGRLSSDPGEILESEIIVLPGVGAFDRAMRRLSDGPIPDALAAAAADGRATILGICLGMHLLFDGSEEGELPGLGLIPGHVARFNFERSEAARLKIPHMGWNVVRPVADEPLFRGGDVDEWRFYFVHSYHAVCADPSHISAVTTYGYEFPCVVRRGNIVAAQFHPEKSHRFGKQLFANLLDASCLQ